MTREDSIQVLSLLKVAYPRFYQGMTKGDAESAITLWTSMLSDHRFEAIKLAVQKYIASSKFPPTIADIRESLIPDNFMTGDEAFGQAMKITKLCGQYRENEALERMDEKVSKIVKNLGYKDLCLTENGDNMMTYRAHFLRAWEANKTEIKKQSMIPIVISDKLNALTNNVKRLEG